MDSVLQSNKAQDAVNSLTKSVGNMKISTLMNAARISPLVLERTIGPKESNGFIQRERTPSIDHLENGQSNQRTNNVYNSFKIENQVTPDNSFKFRKDVWREVNIESEQEETPKSLLHLNDCKAIKFRLASNNAEKQRRAKISTDLQEKQSQWDTELEQRLQQIRIDSAEKQKRVYARRLEREKEALRAIEKIEAQAKQDEVNTNAKKSEMIEHSRKLIEHANQLKRQDEMRLLIESINASKLLFINLFELYAKTIINYQTILHQTGKLAEYTQKRDAHLKRYEQIINLINSKSIVTLADTELFESLCADIKQEQNELNNHIQASRETLNQTNEAAAAKNAIATQIHNETNKNAAEVHKTINIAEVSVTDGVANKPSIPAVTTVQNAGTEDRIKQYYELMNFFEEYKNQIQPLIADINMKKFRFNCQKGINTPLNSITGVNVQHLQDKFEKISDLLSGNQVRTGDVQFTAAGHPLGIKYCTLLLAKKFITQGTTVFSSHAPAAFSYAAIFVSIWQLFPDVGKLFMALLYAECPFFVPYIIPQRPDQSENDYFSLLGYKFNDGKMEDQESYLKRISGLQRLYSAILITNPRRNQQQMGHPHGIENGWIWFSNFLMLDPLPGISSTLLAEFVHICGYEMLQVYKKQFFKLIIVLNEQYIFKLDKVDRGGPYERLKRLVNDILVKGKIEPPIGALQPNFW